MKKNTSYVWPFCWSIGPNETSRGLGFAGRLCIDRIRFFSKVFVAFAVFTFAAMIPVRAELNEEIDLIRSHGLRLQAQNDLRWARFKAGPFPGSPDIDMGRCGCFLTSLSTALEAVVGDGGASLGTGSLPWTPHQQSTADQSGYTPFLFSLSPIYVNDYLKFHPNDAAAGVNWGFVVGTGGCGVQLEPSAADFIANPHVSNGSAYTPNGLTWDTLSWSSIARQDVDYGLQHGWPSIVTRHSVSGSHANLIVGWDNVAKKYLIYDPMWRTTFSLISGIPYVNYMGHNFTGANADERYRNYQAAIENVKPLRPVYQPTRSRWLTLFDRLVGSRPDQKGTNTGRLVDIAAPIKLRLTDPRGRRAGYDPASGHSLQEDKTAYYSEFTSWADPLGVLPEAAPVRYIAARDPEAGVYGLEVFGTGNGPFTLKLGTIDGDHQLDAATITGNITNGETKRYEITYPGPGLTPTVVAVAAFRPQAKAGNDTTAYVGNTVAFDGRGSRQIAGTISAYSWNYGDRVSATGAQQAHAYAAVGTYTATLTVTNTDGLTANDTRIVTVVLFGSQILKETIRVSVTDTGGEANNLSWFGAQVTPDGRYVTFFSRASNLVSGDTNGGDDVFVKDLSNGAVDRVSVSTAGVQQNDATSDPSISADGRFVAFFSTATNLVTGFSGDLYVRDRLTGTTEGIAQTNHSSSRPSFSSDGRYLAFSSADPLLPSAPSAAAYVRDRQLGTLELVSTLDGTDPRISSDGRFVAFAGTVGSVFGVYVRDRQTASTELVSRNAAGSAVAGFNPSISADGRFVSFATLINSFPPQRNVFVRDRSLGTTEQINVGTGLTNVAYDPTMDATGRYVSFLVSSTGRAYLRDRVAGTTEIVSVANDGTTLGTVSSFGIFNSSRFAPSVSSNGSVVFFSNSLLVADDTNGVDDVFIRRPQAGNPGGVNEPPLANLTGPYLGWATSTAVPAAIRLDGSGSVDPLGGPLTAHWNFGDGLPVFDGALVVNHAYAKPGIYQVTLTVSSAGGTSAVAHTEVEVLPALPSDGIAVSACSATGGTISFDGAATAFNAALIANGWNTSTGPVQTAPVTVVLPWAQVVLPTKLPGLTFGGSSVVPGGTAAGSYSAAISGGPSGAFKIPCGTIANLPPLAVAGGPIYTGLAGNAVTLHGEQSSDPENAPLTYRWEFGDGTSGTGPTPIHTYQFPASYFVTLIVNDGTQDSAVMVGSRSFAMVVVNANPTAASVSVSGRVLTSVNGRGLRNATVVLTDQAGVARRVLTGRFGYYRFDDVAAGGTYIISVMSRRYQFEPRVITVTDELTDIDFDGHN